MRTCVRCGDEERRWVAHGETWTNFAPGNRVCTLCVNYAHRETCALASVRLDKDVPMVERECVRCGAPEERWTDNRGTWTTIAPSNKVCEECCNYVGRHEGCKELWIPCRDAGMRRGRNG